MTLTIPCPSCQSPLQVRAEYAGMRIKCPRCSETVSIPPAEGAAATPATEESIEEVRPVPRPVPRPGGPSTAVEEAAAAPRPPLGPRERDRDHDDRRRPRRGQVYKPCPRCANAGAARVTWTPWGSFYGPAILNHVRCPECGCTYNGRTGRSNAVGIFFFTLIPLLLLVAINIGLWLAIARLGSFWVYVVVGMYIFEGVVALVLLILSLVRSGGHGPHAPRREREGP